MHAIVVWMEEDSPVPSVLGPYEGNKAFEDANFLRERCYKVQVCNITSPENSKTLNLKSSASN